MCESEVPFFKTHTNLFCPHKFLSGKHCYYSIRQLRRLRHRHVKQIDQGYTIGKWRDQDSNPGNLALDSKLLTIHHCCIAGCMSGLCTKFWRSLYHALSFPIVAYSIGFYRSHSHAQYRPPCLLWFQKCSRNNLHSWGSEHLEHGVL